MRTDAVPTSRVSTPGGVRQWGYNAANDLQGIYLNYIGSAGGMFSDGDRFAFDNPGSAAAFDYLVRLINDDHVAPPASDTNGNGDFSRNQFLQGRMALFQSGTYNLASIADQAPLSVGGGAVAGGAGLLGRASPTALPLRAIRHPEHPDAVRQVLAWMGSARGNQYLGARARPSLPYSRHSGCTSITGRSAASTSGPSSRCSTAREYRRPADRGSPRDTRRCSRTSTRCSSGAAMWPPPWPMPRRRPTRRPSANSCPAA